MFQVPIVNMRNIEHCGEEGDGVSTVGMLASFGSLGREGGAPEYVVFAWDEVEVAVDDDILSLELLRMLVGRRGWEKLSVSFLSSV